MLTLLFMNAHIIVAELYNVMTPICKLNLLNTSLLTPTTQSVPTMFAMPKNKLQERHSCYLVSSAFDCGLAGAEQVD